MSDVFLETERLVFRRLTEDDADELFELDSDPEVMAFLTGGVPHTYAFIVERALPHYLEYYDRFDAFGFWAAIEKADRAFIGWFHLRPYKENPQETELGYRLKRAYWGRGLATEGSKALIDRGFRELGVAKIVATTMAANARSRAVMERLGMTLDHEFAYPGDPFPGWRVEDCREVKYGMTRSQWEVTRRLADGRVDA